MTVEPLTLTTRPLKAVYAAERTERRVSLLAVCLAAGYLGLAIGSLLLPAAVRLGTWIPVHLVLAGAAVTAIAGLLPRITVKVSVTSPVSGPIRWFGVTAVAGGALLIFAGRMLSPSLADSPLAALGGLVYISGLIATGYATLSPLRAATRGRGKTVGITALLAITNVVIGSTLAVLLLSGSVAVLTNWGNLKPAHAWLNVFGFISLVIVASLMHLLPTIAGTRITNGAAARLATVLLSAGPLVVAAGFGASSDALTVGGALIVVAGAICLFVHAARVVAQRFAWTTDFAWHRFATWSLAAAVGWFVVATLTATTPIVIHGAAPAAWQMTPLIAPLFLGWIAQAIVGSWTHLLLSISPGSPTQHARQREILGRAANARLLLMNLGVAALFAGIVLDADSLSLAGLAAVIGAVASAIVLLALALNAARHAPEGRTDAERLAATIS